MCDTLSVLADSMPYVHFLLHGFLYDEADGITFPSDQKLWAPQNLRSINKRIDTQKLPTKEWNKFTNRQGVFFSK